MNSKSQMLVVSRGKTRRINCFPHERDYIAKLARQRRESAAKYGDPRPTVQSMRETAAGRYL